MNGITEQAARHITEALREANIQGDGCARFVFAGNEAALRVDRQRPGDKTFRYQDQVVLVVAPDVADACADCTLDFQNGCYRFI